VPTVSAGERAIARAAYDRDGYVIVRGAIDGELIGEAARHVDWLRERHPDTRPENLDTALVHHDPFWVRLVSDPRLLDIAAEFVGPSIALFASHYVAKPPLDGQPVLWHQDGSYWPLDPMEVVSLWLALDPSTPANGCMRVIPKSHRMTLHAVSPRNDTINVLGSGMETSLVDESQAVDLVLAPGDVSIHHPNLIHGSEANRSSHWRRGLTIRYIPTSSRVVPRPGRPSPTPLLLRGEALPGINQYGPWPAFDPERHMWFRGSEAWAPPNQAKETSS
jgi:ectoine hydroxylase-related dioxygenase (phytanoyl-CoA dioxygenase family)